MNFDGILCEVLFNTFSEWKITMFSFIILMCLMLIYPISSFFKKLMHALPKNEIYDLRTVFISYIFAVF